MPVSSANCLVLPMENLPELKLVRKAALHRIQVKRYKAKLVPAAQRRRKRLAEAVDRLSKALRVKRLDLVAKDIEIIKEFWPIAKPRWPKLFRKTVTVDAAYHSHGRGGMRLQFTLGCGHVFKEAASDPRNGTEIVRCRLCEWESWRHVERLMRSQNHGKND